MLFVCPKRREKIPKNLPPLLSAVTSVIFLDPTKCQKGRLNFPRVLEILHPLDITSAAETSIGGVADILSHSYLSDLASYKNKSVTMSSFSDAIEEPLWFP